MKKIYIALDHASHRARFEVPMMLPPPPAARVLVSFPADPPVFAASVWQVEEAGERDPLTDGVQTPNDRPTVAPHAIRAAA